MPFLIVQAFVTFYLDSVINTLLHELNICKLIWQHYLQNCRALEKLCLVIKRKIQTHFFWSSTKVVTY